MSLDDFKYRKAMRRSQLKSRSKNMNRNKIQKTLGDFKNDKREMENSND